MTLIPEIFSLNITPLPRLRFLFCFSYNGPKTLSYKSKQGKMFSWLCLRLDNKKLIHFLFIYLFWKENCAAAQHKVTKGTEQSFQ